MSESRLRVPADLILLVAVVALGNAVIFHPALDETPIRPVAGLVFVLIAPGYALVAALFPARGQSTQQTRHSDNSLTSQTAESSREWEIDWIERIALGFALSLAVVPLLALVVTVSPFAFGPRSVFAAITLWTLGTILVAAGRWLLLPGQERYGMTTTEMANSIRSVLGGSPGETLLNVVLVFAVLFALGSLTFAVLSPPDAETYTDVALLTETTDGELTAADYPDSLAPGEQEQFHVRLENRERETIDYDVVVQLQQVNGSTPEGAVTARLELDRFSTTLDHGEVAVIERTITAPPGVTGENLRMQILLYEDGMPADPTGETAYRKLHIWVDIGGELTAESE